MDVELFREVSRHVGAAVVVPVVLGDVIHVVEDHAVVRAVVGCYQLEARVEQHRSVEREFTTLKNVRIWLFCEFDFKTQVLLLVTLQLKFQ